MPGRLDEQCIHEDSDGGDGSDRERRRICEAPPQEPEQRSPALAPARIGHSAS